MTYPQITGTIEPLEEPWQERVARLLREARNSLNSKRGLIPGHPIAEFVAGLNRAVRPSGETGLMAPPDQPPAGMGTIAVPDPEAWSRWGRGDAPYTTGETGLAGRLPMLKPGRAADALNIGATAPLGTAMNTPGALGVIRMKGDIVTPQVAERLSTAIGPNLPADVKEKLAKYLHKEAGLPTDSLQKVPLLTADNAFNYPQLPGEPLDRARPGQVYPGVSLQEFRERFRRDLPAPDSNTLGAAVDDIIGGALGEGYSKVQTVKGSQEILALPAQEQERVRRMAAVLTGHEISPASLPEVAERNTRALSDIARGSDIFQENIPGILSSLPEGGSVALVRPGTGGSHADAGNALRSLLQEPRFRDFLDNLPAETRGKMTFPDIVRQFGKREEADTKEFLKTFRGQHVEDAVHTPGLEWQELSVGDEATRKKQLSYQGKKLHQCIGQEQYGYPRAVCNGEMRVFALREKETNKPVASVAAKKKRGFEEPLPSGPVVLRAVQERIAGGLSDSAIDALASDLSVVLGDTSRVDVIKRELHGLRTPGRRLDPGSSWTVYTLENVASGLNSLASNPNFVPALNRLMEALGFPRPGQLRDGWEVAEAKGFANAREGLPSEVKQEILRFAGSHPDLLRTTTGDLQALQSGAARGGNTVDDDTLRRIALLYDPNKASMGKHFGRDVLTVRRGSGYDPQHYWLEGGRPMYSTYDSSLGPVSVGDALEGEGPFLTELSRRIRGGKEPGANIREALTEYKHRNRERVIESWESYGYTPVQMQHPDGGEVLGIRVPPGLDDLSSDYVLYRTPDGDEFVPLRPDGTPIWEQASPLDLEGMGELTEGTQHWLRRALRRLEDVDQR